MPEQHSGKRGQSMDYKLVISKHVDELLDNLVYYLLYRLKSEQAARHLLDGIDGIYGWKQILFNFHSAEMLIWRIKATTKQLFHRWTTLSFLM